MYNFVTKEGGHAYVKSGLNTARVIGAETSTGTKYVKTVADSTTADNLLKLPECQ
jgi:hypothetical protein